MSSSDIEDEVEYETEKFYIADHVFELTTVSYMPIERLLDLQSKAQEISGQKLWCGSLCVMEYLIEHPEYIKGFPILELGAGTGILGMLCYKMFSSSVILTDNDQTSLTHMKKDCIKNDVICNVNFVDWFTLDSLIAMNLDSEKSMKILAGDVLYKRTLLEPFFNVVKYILGLHPNNEMILCHVPRAGVDHEDVKNTACSYNLSIISVEENLWRKGVVHKYSPPEDYNRAQLYFIKNNLS